MAASNELWVMDSTPAPIPQLKDPLSGVSDDNGDEKVMV